MGGGRNRYFNSAYLDMKNKCINFALRLKERPFNP